MEPEGRPEEAGEEGRLHLRRTLMNQSCCYHVGQAAGRPRIVKRNWKNRSDMPSGGTMCITEFRIKPTHVQNIT